ncbi:sugar phosphate isomerase/epimerase family protein [Fictibacillus fluitans]|uniref:Sugar phosphate isomerase/epimerase family protein n=1 Tax=Fictibacillus fluitans TaxID=3058422 RepID=A0ABT8HTE4_9BACL|nr:sugar phosphate isomerase/epimerase family protein [Fictibacillus sp. NE201]MDN4524062.1 sugar phosphate isomerase/epimerase family protein [Fictibacillus sp. NE201]
MKLAFTTLGCPGWSLGTMISHARQYGYEGIDFRGYQGEMEIYRLPEFSTTLEETKERFMEAELEIPCFSSSVRLFTESKEEQKKYLEELKQYADLCEYFETPFIRVFGGSIGDHGRGEAVDIAAENTAEYLKVIEGRPVTLLLETHDDWTSCQVAQELLSRVDSSQLEVLWDVHHPYRTLGEEPEQTWNVLGKHIRYTHWKDSYVKEDHKRGYQLCLLGDGDLPLYRMYRLLKDEGYQGYFTLEWEKVWCPEIEEPEIAFKQYAHFMKKLEQQVSSGPTMKF